jgi:hypothetical protein
MVSNTDTRDDVHPTKGRQSHQLNRVGSPTKVLLLVYPTDFSNGLLGILETKSGRRCVTRMELIDNSLYWVGVLADLRLIP